MKSLIWRVLRHFSHLALLLLVLLTAYVTLGRLLMPLVATRKDAIEAQLTALIGVPVTIDDIKGSWFRLGPSLTITNLRVGDPTKPGPLHSIARIELLLNATSSLLAHQPVISRVSVSRLSLTLQELAGGKWTLSGLPPPVKGGNNTDTMLDFLLDTKVLTIRDSAVTLLRLNGERVELGSIFLNIENGFSSHNAQLQLRINDSLTPAHLVLRLQGDPRRSFAASTWLDTEQLDLLPLVKAQLPDNWQWQQLQGRGQFWADIDSNGIQKFTADLQDLAIKATAVDKQHQLAVEHGSFKLLARPVYSKSGAAPDWLLRVQDAGFDWQNQTFAISKLQLRSFTAPTPRWQLQADELDLAMIAEIVTKAVSMPEAALEALQTLAPRGGLRNVMLETALDGTYPKRFLLQGNLHEVAVNAWRGAPAGSGVNGFVEANAEDGKVEVDSQDFTLHLPELFEKPWHYDKVNARVSWEAAPDEVRVYSSIIDVANADLAGRISFDLHNLRNDKEQWSDEFTLLIGMNRMQVAVAPDYLPTLPSIKTTMDWLRSALQGGELEEGGFVLHTLFGSAVPEHAPFVGSWYRAHDANLKFLPDWPAVTGATATVVQRNNRVDVLATNGTIAGIKVDAAEAMIRPGPKDEDVLSVRARTNTSTAMGLDFLRTTPIHNTVGTFLDNWQATGDMALLVGVGIDLHDHDKPPLIRVDTLTHNSLLDMSDFDLQLRNIDGAINFNNREGLQSKKLLAQLFGNVLTASISTSMPGTAQQAINFSGSGKVALPALKSWSGQPVFVRELLNYMQGEADYKATLTVGQAPHSDQKQTTLLIDSDLVGISSSLPQPLDKAKSQQSPLELVLGFENDHHSMDFRYRDWLTGFLQLDQQGIERGMVSVGERNRTFNVRQSDNNTPGVLISGDMGSFDVKAWQEIARKMNHAGGQGRDVADYLRLVDVNIGELKLGSLTFNKVNVLVSHPAHEWDITGHNELLSGTLLVPDDDSKPWQVQLKYLRLPAWVVVDKSIKHPPEAADPLQDIDPRQWPAFDFKSDEISAGGQNLGAFSLQFRPNALGASISNFRMQSPDSRITDTTRTVGASAEWHYKDGKHQSSFTGLFAAGDLAKVLPAWGNDAIATSKNASFDGSLQWPGSPLYFSLKRASGSMRVNVNEGRFAEIPSGKTRLFGPLNFDALVRRMKLDFSDIFAKGFSFDRIDGALGFTDGVITTTTPLKIDGPTAKLSIQGEINLRDETIAAEMPVQIPFASNVTMITALMGLWPAAVASYIGGKILSKQLGEFTTLVYHLGGTFENPTMELAVPDDKKNDKAAQ